MTPWREKLYLKTSRQLQLLSLYHTRCSRRRWFEWVAFVSACWAAVTPFEYCFHFGPAHSWVWEDLYAVRSSAWCREDSFLAFYSLSPPSSHHPASRMRTVARLEVKPSTCYYPLGSSWCCTGSTESIPLFFPFASAPPCAADWLDSGTGSRISFQL